MHLTLSESVTKCFCVTFNKQIGIWKEYLIGLPTVKVVFIFIVIKLHRTEKKNRHQTEFINNLLKRPKESKKQRKSFCHDTLEWADDENTYIKKQFKR